LLKSSQRYLENWFKQKSAPMIGAESVHQLIDSMGAVELRLSEADLAEISNAAAWERSRTDRED
jgi:aryl-alcohol dehydrogenase-like predicted oxidoreductase